MLTVEYDELLYYGQKGKIKVTSKYENDEITIKCISERVIKINYDATDDNIVEAIGVGEAIIVITNLYDEVISIIIKVEAKEGFAPPIEKIVVNLVEEGPYYPGVKYHISCDVYPEIYNDSYSIDLSRYYYIDSEENAITFKQIRNITIKVISKTNKVVGEVTVNVELDPTQEMYEILFVGNSLTNVNGIPSLVQKMIKEDGLYVNVVMDAPGGVSLYQHDEKFYSLLDSSQFTHVILDFNGYSKYEMTDAVVEAYDKMALAT